MIKKKGFTTRSIHTQQPQKDAYNALHMPVYDGVAYEFDSAEEIEGVFDTTITPPYVFDSAKFGVDVEVMSTTKFISGGAAAVGGVVGVNYPRLEDHVGYQLSKKQFGGKPGGVMSIDLASKDMCYRMVNRLKIVRRATSLNDNKTLIIHPWSTIYAEFSDEEKEKMGIRNTMLRISVGIEDVEDLIEDFSQALQYI